MIYKIRVEIASFRWTYTTKSDLLPMELRE